MQGPGVASQQLSMCLGAPRSYEWVDDDTIAALVVPADRGPAPPQPPAPIGPSILDNTAGRTSQVPMRGFRCSAGICRGFVRCFARAQLLLRCCGVRAWLQGDDAAVPASHAMMATQELIWCALAADRRLAGPAASIAMIAGQHDLALFLCRRGPTRTCWPARTMKRYSSTT